MKRLAGWADAYSLLLAPHNVCGPVGTMANVHLAVATPNYKILEHFNDFADPWVQELVDAPPVVDRADGCFAAPDRPGLGVRLNHDACAKHPRTGGRIQLFEHGWEKREGRSWKAEGRSAKARATRDDVELVFDAKAELGEGPVWDSASECLYFVDIERSRVHRFHPTTHTSRSYDAGSMVGAVALAEAGDLVMAVCHGFARLDLDSGRVRMIAEVEAGRQDQRMNDGKCDPAGRFWAGTMAFDHRSGAGALYRLDPDGRVQTMVRDVTISNGLDWSADGRLMYYIDTPTRSIDVFDFDPASGAIANRRPLVQVADRQGFPDGMTLDADGGIWVAFWGGSAVRRYTADGALDREIRLPVTQPTSCAFGGRDLSDLYITTAATTLSPEERARQPRAGGVFRCRPGVLGRPANRFKG
jgi:sugar lactone lactonase YvrE